MRCKWTPELDAEMLKLIASGLTQRQTGERMGLGNARVRARLLRLKNGPVDIYRKGLSCAQCSGPLSDLAKGNLCRSCNTKALNANPEFQRHRLERLSEKQADPAHKAKMGRIGAATLRTLRNDPAWLDRQRERGARIAREVLRRPDVVARTYAPETISRRAKTYSERAMAWCPAEYRGEYRFLTQTKQLRKPQAQAIIFAQIKADEAKLSPFERQDRALERGAKLVANDPGPSFGEAVDYGEAKWERLVG